MAAGDMSQDDPRSVLVLDDDEAIRTAVCLSLEEADYHCQGVGNPTEALQLLKSQQFQIILCDQNLPEFDGLTFINRCKESAPDSAVLLMTGFGSSELAIQALRAGAQDYIAKPFSMEELLLTMRLIEERRRIKTAELDPQTTIPGRVNFGNIVAKSQSMRDVFETVKRLAGFNTTVLITGESGTGKELLARAIHHNSPRRGKPFIPINCGAIPENLMESELFGHRRGSFTDANRDKKGLFEEAHGGTIFLDEIGELPLQLQVKLLRTLQEKQISRVGDESPIDIDVRVIAATLRNLEGDVLSGRFRDDLFYRLNVVTLHLPALRERTEDIPLLAEHFMKKHSKRLKIATKKLSPEVSQAFINYHWRGNIRELENCIERAMVLADGEEISLAAINEPIRAAGRQEIQRSVRTAIGDDNLSIKHWTRELEIDLIQRALKKTGGNRTHAAKILDISHRALLYKLKEYGIS